MAGADGKQRLGKNFSMENAARNSDAPANTANPYEFGQKNTPYLPSPKANEPGLAVDEREKRAYQFV